MSTKKKANKALLKEINDRDRPLRELHLELFPEEYDEVYDSVVEYRARARGENPMNEEYQRKINLRRLEMGVEPYGGSVGVENVEGLISSWDYCRRVLYQEN
ncbi:hypothetical protein [uncultured Photobacterium sp.]|uniref:hypothetical protein n=1 Tax=uncultured Photobacterium sp. TaxID=173973 RepID=UPI002618EA4A|nr:hypothetical protein [uncultured Photobacterium sp.]